MGSMPVLFPYDSCEPITDNKQTKGAYINCMMLPCFLSEKKKNTDQTNNK